MNKCPECRVGRLSRDGMCRYCDRAKRRVAAARVPMGKALNAFVGVAVAASVVVFGGRALLYSLSYMAVGDLANGDFGAVDRIHTYSGWMQVDWFATIVSALVVARFLQRWIDAGNANALTRPEVGLGWFSGMPSSKVFQRWQRAQSLGYIAIVVLNLAFHNADTSIDRLRAWAVLEGTLCSVVITASIGAAVAARRMTRELLERLATADQAARAARAAQAAQVPDAV